MFVSCKKALKQLANIIITLDHSLLPLMLLHAEAGNFCWGLFSSTLGSYLS